MVLKFRWIFKRPIIVTLFIYPGPLDGILLGQRAVCAGGRGSEGQLPRGTLSDVFKEHPSIMLKMYSALKPYLCQVLTSFNSEMSVSVGLKFFFLLF